MEGQSFVIDILKMTDHGLRINLTCRRRWMPGRRAVRTPLPIQLDILSADGTRAFYVIADDGGAPTLAVKSPFQISAIIATRTRRVDVPFEFNDLSLPK